MSIREVDAGSYKIGKPTQLKAVARVGSLIVYARVGRARGDRPYVVGTIRSGHRILLEDFSGIKAAREWASSQKEGQ